MSVQQTAQTVSDRWGDPISEERQAELKDLADRQRAWVSSGPDYAGDLDGSVFNGIPLSGADVFWLAAYALAGSEGDGDLVAAAARLRKGPGVISGFTVPHLERADLRRVDFREAHLEGAFLNSAHLETLRHMESFE
jgi:uncharacterized protein YjbI with pentapeptide repeats